jgi:hypothetical protein
MAGDHRRALVQLRLNIALLVPNHSLPSTAPFDPCLERDPLDDEAVELMSKWLSKDTSVGNVLGAVSLPLVVQSVMALRSLTGDGEAYLAWRQRWYDLGRYAAQPGRREREDAVLAEAAGRPSLRIRAE